MRTATCSLLSRRLLALTLSVLTLVPVVQAQPVGAELVTSGVFGSTGLAVDGQGWIWATQPGTGNDDARVVVIDENGDPRPFVEGLASSAGVEGPEGANHLLFDGADLWVAVGTGAADPRGFLYRFDTSGFTPGDPPLGPDDAEVSVDVGAFVLGEGFAETNVYGLALGPDGTLYMTDASANAVLARTPAGDLSVLAVFDDIANPTPVPPPFVQAVPTGIVFQDDRLYVAAFTGFPFVEGLSRVYEVDLDGDVTVFRDGLTSSVDLAEDPRDGALAVLRHAVFDLASGWEPGTGRVLRLDDDRVLAYAFDLPSAMAYDAEGVLYVITLPGEVYRVASFSVANEPGAGGPEAPAAFALHTARPNPFASGTAVPFDVAEAGPVRLAVYDVLGREVAVLVDGVRPAGTHEVGLDGSRLSAGVYLVRLTAGDGFVQTRRVTLLR
jgi:sugar lactone lactonase YvrE